MSCLLLSSTCFAATESSETTAYVDSVHQWGAWELDIEPAAGGITQPGTQPMNGRSARVAFRTNSFSAIAPTPVADAPQPVNPIVTPTPPTKFAPPGATPATTVPLPPSTNIGSVTPSTTVPAGTGGLF